MRSPGLPACDCALPSCPLAWLMLTLRQWSAGGGGGAGRLDTPFTPSEVLPTEAHNRTAACSTTREVSCNWDTADAGGCAASAGDAGACANEWASVSSRNGVVCSAFEGRQSASPPQ
eukprot:1160379-Pelagomonas_calceolata.AAC.6